MSFFPTQGLFGRQVIVRLRYLLPKTPEVEQAAITRLLAALGAEEEEEEAEVSGASLFGAPRPLLGPFSDLSRTLL